MTARCLRLLPLLALGVPSALAAQGNPPLAPLDLVEATIPQMRAAIESGLLTAEGLAQRYLARVQAYDKAGPVLTAILAVNPNLVAEARQRDREIQQQRRRGPLVGIPVLLKDNIDALPMPTTAGSVALTGSVPLRDSFIAGKLRQAGAVVFGKATLTEFANFMTSGMPSGYSSLGGHGVNPYDPRRQANGAAASTPGGSSSGSGIASAANLAAVAIGSETAGSILSPSSSNAVVGIKPTVGLVSRSGILPITADQDTAGPMGRSVTDVATVLGVIAGHDPNDPATAACLIPGNCFSDYTQVLDRGALSGARIAVPPVGLGSEQLRILQAALATMRAAGATVVENFPAQGPSLPPICISHPPSAGESTVLIYGMKRDLNAYLAGLGPTAPRKTLADIIAYNNANAAVALRYGQTILVAADLYDPRPGTPDTTRYLADRQTDLNLAKGYLDAALAGPDGQANTPDDFDALLFAANFGADAPARAGYPSVCVPAGFIARSGLPSLPFGITFTGRAFDEKKLIALAFAFEQATGHRVPPASAPALATDRIPLALSGVVPLGTGCAGANGVPTIRPSGPPILANGVFTLRLAAVRQQAPVFVGISTRSGFTIFGTCLVRVALPFDLVLQGTSDASGQAALELPIPFLPGLAGQKLWMQGGALDAAGAGLGVVALTGGLEVTIGG
ncbi:MAG: amidase [Planctomycetes bacterium]|nr:amidase [Planctomycetota bacterium]